VILILDGNNIAYRALFTLKLSTSDGQDVSVLYGVLKMVISLIKKHHPQSIIVAFDGGVPPFRRALYPEYKAHRTRDDSIDWNDVFYQLDELCTYILPRMGIMTLHHRNVEADDFMAQAATLAMDHPYIVTTDNDLLQMVTSRISVLDPTSGKIYTQDNFEELVGVKSRLYLFYKIMVGDHSDGISGVRGIGHITAIKMMREFDKWWNGEFGNVWDGYAYDALEFFCVHDWNCLSDRQQESLRQFGIDNLLAAYDVMDLHIDRTGVGIIIGDSNWTPMDVDFVRNYFMRYEFVSLLGKDNINPFTKLVKPALSQEIRTPVWAAVRMPRG